MKPTGVNASEAIAGRYHAASSACRGNAYSPVRSVPSGGAVTAMLSRSMSKR